MLWNTNESLDGQEKISQVRLLRLSWLEDNLTAFRSSLPRRRYHRSSDLKTNYPQKFSLLKVNTSRYTPSLLPNLFMACGIFDCSDLPVTRVSMLCYVTRGINWWEIIVRFFPLLVLNHLLLDQSKVTKTSAKGHWTVQRPRSAKD